MATESATSAERIGRNQLRRIGVEMICKPAPAAGNVLQAFLYNPAASLYSYTLRILTTRVSNAVQSDAPQHFMGTDVLNDASVPDALHYLAAGAAVVPPLRAFFREVAPAGVLQGNHRLSQRLAGTLQHTMSVGYLADLLLVPGSWYAWAPPELSGIVTLEASVIEYPNV